MFPNTNVPKPKSRGIQHTPELDRILHLPRRKWRKEDLESLADQMTEVLRRPAGDMHLRPVQAWALWDLAQKGGLFSPIRVGGGKTLVSFLAPYVVESVRPLLLIPAALQEKTYREMRELSPHWLIPGHLRILNYEMLSRVQQADLLDKYRPDLIIADEAQKLKNLDAGVTKRVRRYMEECPDTSFVALSGTMTNRSIKDYGHILYWCIKDEMPLPRSQGEIEEWALALDEKVNAQSRLKPGKLLLLCNDREKEISRSDEIKAARVAYQRRLADTEGIVTTTELFDGASIEINEIRLKCPPAVEELFEKLKHDWETPDGMPIEEGFLVYMLGRQLGMGFYYVWDPPPPPEWLEARKEWASACRAILQHNRRNLDTELQVVQALAPREGFPKGYYPEAHDKYVAWARARDLPRPDKPYKPNTVPIWVDPFAINASIDWMEKKRGIVWIEYDAFGEKLSEVSGVPYYGEGGKTKNGRMIEDARPGYPLIASIGANHKGRNLQAWNTNLITSMPTSGAITEQLMGRTHREGQKSDLVTFDVIVSCHEHLKSFYQATRDAQYAEDTMGQAQKLLHSDICMTPIEDLPEARRDRGCSGYCSLHGKVY